MSGKNNALPKPCRALAEYSDSSDDDANSTQIIKKQRSNTHENDTSDAQSTDHSSSKKIPLALTHSEALIIDGAMMEGGGQILRISTGLAVHEGRNIKIKNIRAGRPKPGLARQHYTGIDVATRLRKGITTENVAVGSTEIGITLDNLVFGGFIRENIIEHVDIGTAGSIALVIQTIVPILLECENSLVQIKGGTRVSFSPWVDYFEKVFLPMAKLDDIFKVETVRQGFMPAGGGLVKLHRKLGEWNRQPYNYESAGDPVEYELYSWGAGRMFNAGKQVADLVQLKLRNNHRINVANNHIHIQKVNDNKANCLGVLAVVRTSTGCIKACSRLMNGTRGENFAKFSERLAKEFAEKCVFSEATVDDHLADQMIIMMALSKPGSVIRCNYPLSLHARTAIEVVKMFLPDRKFEVVPDGYDEASSKTARVICDELDAKNLVKYGFE